MRFVISAAGLGSRLGGNIPKCLLPIGDACLIDYQLALLPPDADVRIVVGFREHDVIAHVRRRWSDVTFVRNPAYATTSNTHSVHLAARHLASPFVAIDGDLVISPDSFASFLRSCSVSEGAIVGIAPKMSQDAVGVRTVGGDVIGFLRPGSAGHAECTHEWCGIAYVKGFPIEENRRFFFEELTQHLPLPYALFNSFEIDTPADHSAALDAINRGLLELPTLPRAR
jgi:choline kinase